MSERQVRLRLSDVRKTYSQGDRRLEILKGVNLSLYRGELCALVGPSGSGKSTLLHLAGLLEMPDHGAIEIAEQSVTSLNDRERTAVRRHRIGFVYQYHHLLPEFSALENLIVPQMIAGRSKREATGHGKELLHLVGLGERMDHRPARLSGGEQQRVALARAIINQPALLLADEPTGNLDPETANEVFGLLTKLVQGTGVGALIATHNLKLARRMHRVLRLRDGFVEEG